MQTPPPVSSDPLREAAQIAMELLTENLVAFGPCDHDVGICNCDIERAIDSLHEALSSRATEPDRNAALTDEQINAVYQRVFNARSDRKRDAPPAHYLVFEFARAILATRTATKD